MYGIPVRTHNYQTKVKCHRLTSEQGEEGTVYIDKDITLVGGDSKRIRLELQAGTLAFIY